MLGFGNRARHQRPCVHRSCGAQLRQQGANFASVFIVFDARLLQVFLFELPSRSLHGNSLWRMLIRLNVRDCFA